MKLRVHHIWPHPNMKRFLNETMGLVKGPHSSPTSKWEMGGGPGIAVALI